MYEDVYEGTDSALFVVRQFIQVQSGYFDKKRRSKENSGAGD